MPRYRYALVWLLLTVAFQFSLSAQKNNTLSHSLPESEGVSSTGIIDFLNAEQNGQNELHSVVILRHGKIIAEGWNKPYSGNLKHTMYSLSKSFTATAVGFAVNEKRVSINDKVISFFPDQLPDTVSPYLKDLTIRDLLTMSAGQDPDPTFAIATQTNWVKSFLATPIVHKPGSQFLYNTMATYMLSAIVQKVTGQKIVDYLKPRLFDPLGIKDVDWEMDTKGINTGGWGLRLKTEDMAKFGQVFLQKGAWNGKQVIPASWVEEASTVKIMQDPGAPQSKKDSSDWLQGYCYQMWRCRHNAYRGDGAYGQYIIIMPEEDAVVAITSETPDMQNELNLVWQYLLPAMHSGKLSADQANHTNLQQKLASLQLPVPPKSVSPLEKTIAGKTFAVQANDKHIQSFTFNFDSLCHLTLKTDTAVYSLAFASGRWKEYITGKPGPSLLRSAKEDFSVLAKSKVAAGYQWNNDRTLKLVLRYIESPHTETYMCNFDGRNITVTIKNSFDAEGKKAELRGSSD
jgi:CubicO group peptidase (beta-lactamase class C family)